MNIEARTNHEGKVRTVRIDMTNADVQRIRNTPTAPIGRGRITQWALNVVRALGYTPDDNIFAGQPRVIVDMKRGVSNDGFVATVWVQEGQS